MKYSDTTLQAIIDGTHSYTCCYCKQATCIGAHDPWAEICGPDWQLLDELDEYKARQAAKEEATEK